jgi:hypothetical protein
VDSYILKGSCGLEYSLEGSGYGGGGSYYGSNNRGSAYNYGVNA